MSSDVLAIRVESLSKRYEVYGRPEDRLKQFLLPRLVRMAGLNAKNYFHEFWALRDVSFQVRAGETIGIIGRNGAGKSTLLQMIAGTLTPTMGSVEVYGRVSALLELGAGFNAEFSGRDNVYMYGALLGLRREELDEKFAAIHEFSGIEHFIDEPVKTYSSGMYARLAFSVAVHCDPAILIVDEALSVGDMEFQERCITRMKQVRDQGTSILFVTHSVPTVRNFCERAVWLEHGAIKMNDDAAEVCRAYIDEVETNLKKRNTNRLDVAESNGAATHESGRLKTVFIRGVELNKSIYAVGESIELTVRLGFSASDAQYGVGVLIRNSAGKLVAILNTIRDDIFLDQPHDTVSVVMADSAFPPGRYFITLSLCDHDAMFSYDFREECVSFEVRSEFNRFGIPRWEGQVATNHAWKW